MKLTLILTFVSFIGMFANSGYSQSLTLEVENMTIDNVINKIELTSKYTFVYNTRFVDLQRRVSLKFNDASISEVLEQLFENARPKTSFHVIDTEVFLNEGSTLEENSKTFDHTQKQAIQITGSVIDNTGQPLPGANILEKGTTNGTQADFDGNFSISVEDENAVLTVSYIGYATKEISINGQTNIMVSLEESAVGMDEVVVVGYGTQSRHNVTGAISSISEEDISGRQVRSLDQMMQGKMAGVAIKTNSGKPGSEGADIIIRGVNSFGTSSYPLVLIDGIEGEINSVAPENVQSVSVMKDAASAAIYGSRAANGVVLITTKRGRAGELNITYNANFSNQTNLFNRNIHYKLRGRDGEKHQ
ncbi:carboxypeptidase-like regulatory domain-containing protein [Arenibacter sp. M-2]|uniref:SusC/RagA family TonB-linked outer membrane protein n=1 Tax=Arenibacter sp. M-2 TaxID=3053612 RepID=UPI002570EDC5|nr:SusC/RagA family TonB-linked outer membrane protein [Arenibacter sp. M-2]MDL5511278.1 carboxypeptidase-like regulatory domain-containing protein [Arenibacter sp. M-2]